jgi:hypothetical protein
MFIRRYVNLIRDQSAVHLVRQLRLELNYNHGCIYGDLNALLVSSLEDLFRDVVEISA